MDITDAIANFNQAALMSKVQFAVARKVLDAQKLQGNAAIELIKAASGNADTAGDQLVAAATGLGSELDVHG
jgi:hypothetical protein